MKKSCASCDRPLRAGSTRRALVALPDGVRYALVCTHCHVRAISIVVPPAITVPVACSSCGKDAACICERCAGRLAGNVRELAASNVALRAAGGRS